MIRKLLLVILHIYSVIQLNARDVSKSKQPIDFFSQKLHLSNFNKKSDKVNESKISDAVYLTKEVRQVDFEVENEIISLKLTPLDHNVCSYNTSIWTVETDLNENTGHVFKAVNSTHLSGDFYEDFEKKTVVYRTSNYYDGVIGEGREKKVIKFLEEKLRSKYIENKLFSSNTGKIITTIGSLKSNNDFVHFQKMNKSLEILYPKLLLVIEWNYFRMLGEDIFDAMKYLSLFWNAVNLKYKEISIPKVNIIISGIVISKDNAALDFIMKARNKQNSDQLDSLKLLSLGNSYFRHKFKKEVNFRNFDSAVLMTNLTAGSVRGITIRGQVCEKNILYVTDDANFGGILKATHELGHSLGLTHDDRSAISSLNTSVMGPYIRSPNEYYWSQKSLDQIQAFAMTRQARCLENSG